MDKLTRILGLIILTTVIFSCATVTPRQRMMVGRWKPVKIENADIPEHKTANLQKSVTDTLAPKAGDSTKAAGTGTDPKQAEKLKRLIQTEFRSELQLNADKTAVKYFHGKMFNATWKLKKKETLLVAKSADTGQKVELEILRVNDTSATVIQRSPYGNLRITFHKEK